MWFDRIVYAVSIFGFPLGVLVGYMWRDRISRARRARYLAEQDRRDAERARNAVRAIAPDLGVDHQTVDGRAKPEDDGEIPHHAEAIGKDGISQPRKKRAKAAARKPNAPKAAPS
jgi:hypothetical protein